MSAPRSDQPRDRLGRFTAARRGLRSRLRATVRPGSGAQVRPRSRARVRSWVGSGLRAWAGPAARRALAALRSDLARRLGRLAVVAAALASAVVLLYAHGDSPAALARTVQTTPATAKARAAGHAAAGQPGPSTTGRAAHEAAQPGRPAATQAGDVEPRPGSSAPPGAPGAKAGATGAKAGPTRPADVAAAWYAARNHLPAGKVQALQQDTVSARAVRVLVLADHGNGRLDTALVTVRRDATGRWTVP